MSKINELPGHLIRRLNQISVAIFTDRMIEQGIELTPVQFGALSVIEDNPGIDQASLAGAVAHDRATIGGVIDRLENKGLVKRIVSAHDRRARELTLTSDGAKLLKRINPIVLSLQDDILVGLTKKEEKEFKRLLLKTTEAGNALSRAQLK